MASDGLAECHTVPPHRWLLIWSCLLFWAWLLIWACLLIWAWLLLWAWLLTDGHFVPADLNHDGKLDANEWLLLLQLQHGMLPALMRWSNVPFRNELVKQLRLAMKKSAERRQRALWHGALAEEGAVSGAAFDFAIGDGDEDAEEEPAGQGGRSRSRTRRNHKPTSAPAEQHLAAEQQLAAEQKFAEIGKRRRRRRKARQKTQGGNVLQFY